MAQQILEIRVSHKGIKPVRNGHPWIFKNALAGSPRAARVSPSLERSFFGPNGLSWNLTTPALICDQAGEQLGWGTYNPHSRLAGRILSRDPSKPYLADDLGAAVRAAVDERHHLFRNPAHTAFRLIYGEADGIPGVVADLFDDVVSLQYSAAFAWDNAGMIETALIDAVGSRGITARPVRSVDDVMFQREGIRKVDENGAEEHFGDGEAAEGRTVLEHGLPWFVFPGGGQKTGFYCDQRENRPRLYPYARNARVLDAFCYHGGFGLHTLHGGARSVCFADRSTDAMNIVRQNAALQKIDAERFECVDGDLFERFRRNDVPGGLESYDLIVLDPPKLVPARKNLTEGLRAYKDLHLSVFRHAKRGARVMTFSCSGAVGLDDFRRTIAWAASDCGRAVVVEDVLTQGADHPVPLAFPEAEYLKGLLLYIRNDRQYGTIRRQ